MLLMHNLSFRYKIPLRAMALVLITAFSLTAVILASEYDNTRTIIFTEGDLLAQVLSENLRDPLRHDEVWRSYEIIHAPLVLSRSRADLTILVDPLLRIIASTHPGQFRMLTPVSTHGQDLEQVADAIVNAERQWQSVVSSPEPLNLTGKSHYFVVSPILSDGVFLGALVLRYPKNLYWPRFIDIGEHLGGITLGVLILLLPLSWFWGAKMAQPMVSIARCLGQVRHRIPTDTECHLYESEDELGQISSQLRLMFETLREKQTLERQMMNSERLAAIRRLAAGIAHEVNNPLGGMLNAISTHRKHGSMTERTTRTLDMLERGLKQIRDIVSALLVEARPETSYLAPVDINDVRMLILPDLQRKSAHLRWDVECEQPISLPASLIRQVLINLLLNATRAISEEGHVAMRLRQTAGMLDIQIGNDGAYFSPEKLGHLFESFQDISDGSSPLASEHQGMGLWITYQIVRQLNGRIDVDSRPGWTGVHVTIPVVDDPSLV